MLKYRKRHEEECVERRKKKDPSASEYDSYARCRCPYHVSGTLAGQFIRKSLKTSDAERAAKLIQQMEEEGTPSLPDNRVTIKHAIERYLTDVKVMNRSAATIGKYTHDLEKQFLPWCEGKGYTFLVQVNKVDVIREYRTTWKNSSVTMSKKQDRLVTFFGVCEANGWIPRSLIKGRSLGKIKVVVRPTDYFNADEMKKILDACAQYRGDRWSTNGDAGTRLRALTLLMRWTGLRIGDALALRRERLVKTERGGDAVFLYTQKTGTHVYCPVPPKVAEELRTIPPGLQPHPDYFFWSGNGIIKSAVADWQRSYKKLFDLAGLTKRAYPHMFRDTFAVEALLAGVPLDRVSILLGHSSVKITEKHYKPWVKALQHQLEDDVVKSWRDV
jgi:integrase/recombinase XerD